MSRLGSLDWKAVEVPLCTTFTRLLQGLVKVSYSNYEVYVQEVAQALNTLYDRYDHHLQRKGVCFIQVVLEVQSLDQQAAKWKFVGLARLVMVIHSATYILPYCH